MNKTKYEIHYTKKFKKQYKKFLKAEAKYSTLEEAYDAYVKALAKDEYKGVREKCL